MNIGIVGLGLIGGSIAKAVKENTDHLVYGADIQESVLRKAILLEAIDDSLSDERLGECDMVIIALYPKDAVEYIKQKASSIKKGAVVIDCCGVKQFIMDEVLATSKENDFILVGGHPMAGIEYSGFAYSQKALFQNASMILTPTQEIDIHVLDEIKRFWLKLGFKDVVISTPEKHDKLIAFTSQLAHIVSSAYVKSPSALEHKGYSAGSYKDLTRVAKLNPDMWTELFMLNRENLLNEIDGIIERLQDYRDVLEAENTETLHMLLQEGTKRKLTID